MGQKDIFDFLNSQRDKNKQKNKWYSVPEIAKGLGVSVNNVYHHCVRLRDVDAIEFTCKSTRSNRSLYRALQN